MIPFVGPTFGYGMPPGADVPAWEWNASHFQRHVIPGVAAILAGAMILWRARAVIVGGAYLAVAAGIWMIINPWVVRAWLGGGGGGGGAEPSTVMQIITPLGYHYVPGMITIGLGAFLVGWLQMNRRPSLERGHAEEAAPAYRPVERDRRPAGAATTAARDDDRAVSGRR